MTKARDDGKTTPADDRPDDDKTARRKSDAEESNDDDTGPDEAKRFERSDNLRRRSEWFQKRSGGGS